MPIIVSPPDSCKDEDRDACRFELIVLVEFAFDFVDTVVCVV
jgi:hypothetical protein